MRTAKTAIAPIQNRGRTLYRLTYPTLTGRKRELFGTKEKAEERMAEILGDKKDFGEKAAAMSSQLRADAIHAAHLLEGTGRTLTEAVRFFLADIKAKESGIPIAEAVEAFLRSRDDRSDDYRATLRPRLEYIGKFFTGRTTASIGVADCQRLLDGLAGTNSRRTVSHYRTHLSVLLAFCESRGWIAGNPAKKTTAVKVTGQEAVILTPQEAANLLSACHRDILPGIVIATFCGLRSAEIERLDWKAVDLAQGVITIGAGVAKTNSRRMVTIPDNAKAWLAPYAQKTGNVWPKQEVRARDLWTLARVQSGYGPFDATSTAVKEAMTDPATKKTREDLTPWPANALRHSAISYRLAMTPDLAKISYESGNSPAIIQRHYNGLAKPEAAKLFFSIMPDAPENMRTFVAA